MDLTGRTALISGSSRGIGRAIALRFARAGADIVVNCRKSADRAKAVAGEIEALGRRAVVVQADVGERSEAERLVAEAVAAFGRVDICVANAGIIIDHAFVESTDEEWRAAMHTNLDGFFYLARAVLPQMIGRGWGRVLYTSSIIVDRYDFGGNKMSVCTAAKAAANVMLRSIAAEVAEKGVTVNAVSPGYIATEMFADVDEAGREAAFRMIPMRRYGTPDDIASAMCFLASDEASYITGQTLRVNGGMAMA